MQAIRMVGKAEAEMYRELYGMFPDTPAAPAVKRQLLDYQMVALYGLAKQFNQVGARILEIGTGFGASSYMLSKAAPLAEIVSLTVSEAEAEIARGCALKGCENVSVVMQASWEYVKKQRGTKWSMVFVDGDHNRIAKDMPWFNRLHVGGLFLCHDYSPADSAHPSPIVFQTLNGFARVLARPLDVQIVDDTKTGMAGFYRCVGQVW